jgi:2-keto-3-deoxy-L-fuconate dehydrogenase
MNVSSRFTPTRQGHLATVEDIAPMLVYLASDESRFVTGRALLGDGGVTI